MAEKKTDNKPDWLKIKHEYASSKKSYREIADEFKVSYSTLYKRATRENWGAQRLIYGETADKKIRNRKTNAVARRYQEIDEGYGRIAGQLNDSVDPDGNELYLYPVYGENGQLKGFVELQRVNTEHAKEVLDILGQCKRQMDDLYGIVPREKEMDHEVAMKEAENVSAEGKGDNGGVQVVINGEGASFSE